MQVMRAARVEWASSGDCRMLDVIAHLSGTDIVIRFAATSVA